MDYIRFISVITLTGIWITIMLHLNPKCIAYKLAKGPFRFLGVTLLRCWLFRALFRRLFPAIQAEGL